VNTQEWKLLNLLVKGSLGGLVVPTVTFDLRVTPEEFSAFPTRLATETGSAQALSCDLQEQNPREGHINTDMCGVFNVFPFTHRHNGRL